MIYFTLPDREYVDQVPFEGLSETLEKPVVIEQMGKKPKIQSTEKQTFKLIFRDQSGELFDGLDNLFSKRSVHNYFDDKQSKIIDILFYFVRPKLNNFGAISKFDWTNKVSLDEIILECNR